MTQDATEKGQAKPGSWSRQDSVFLVVLIVVGLALALLPYGMRWFQTGDPVWVCDTDELIPYGQVISHSYHQHPWKLGDPAQPSDGSSMYPWLQFVPAILASKLVGGGTWGTTVLLRVWVGLTLPIASYLLLRRTRRLWLGACLALLFLGDHQMTEGIPILRHFAATAEVLRGNPSNELHQWSSPLRQFRIISPGVSFISLGLALFTIMRLPQDSGRRAILWASLAFGFCIGSYLYFWTCIAAVLVGMAILDRPRWKAYLLVLVLGGMIGSPALLQNFLTKARYGDEWLTRNEYFTHRANPVFWMHGKLFVVYALGAAYVWFLRRTLLPVWLAGAAALAYTEFHYFTGIYIQPAHWLFVAAPMGIVLLFHAGADAWERWAPKGRLVTAAIVSITALHLSGALILRSWATNNNRETAAMESNRQSWKRFLQDAPNLSLATNAVIAGETQVSDWAVISHALRPLTGTVALSPSVNNEQWARRRALNAYLRGFTQTNVTTSAFAEYGVWFHLASLNPKQTAEETQQLQAEWARIASAPQDWIDAFSVRYCVLPITTPFPLEKSPRWRQLARSNQWHLWECTQ